MTEQDLKMFDAMKSGKLVEEAEKILESAKAEHRGAIKWCFFTAAIFSFLLGWELRSFMSDVKFTIKIDQPKEINK